MLLRSSSTPILGSLSSESPNHHHQPVSIHAFSCHLSPIPDSSDNHHHRPHIPRARSDGNLHSLLSDHSDLSSRLPNPILDKTPSFSIYNNATDFKIQEQQNQEEEEEEDDSDEVFYVKPQLEEAEKNKKKKSGTFTFSGEEEKEKATAGSKMMPLFLARGLGIDRLGSDLFTAGAGGGIGDGNYAVQTDSGGDNQSEMEMYYKKMVEENPSNALFLSNYAQFLYEAKGDARRAEEYYSRAVLVEPGNGEILSQYAKLVWELDHDEERASSYFERAVQAAPQDSHVLAAYAGFLWDTEEYDNGDDARGDDDLLHDYSGGAVAFETMAASASA